MATVQGYRVTGKWTIECPKCGGMTTLKYARAHGGQCKGCAIVAGVDTGKNVRVRAGAGVASREEQNARYLECGPANWDDR